MEEPKYIVPKSDIIIKEDKAPEEETTTFSFSSIVEKQVQARVAEEVKKIELRGNAITYENK